MNGSCPSSVGMYFPDTGRGGDRAEGTPTPHVASREDIATLSAALPRPEGQKRQHAERKTTMSSHRARERKAAIKRTKREYRATIASRHFLTFAKRKCSCARCGGVQGTGREVVYRHEPREVICLACAESSGVKWRPSLKWERHVARKRGIV